MEKTRMARTIRKAIITATSVVALLLLIMATVATAAPVGNVTHTSGPIAVKKADGSVRSISIGSAIEQGDTVITQKRTYARIKFTDGTEATLKPNTQFKVEKYSYDQAKPKEDAATYNLVKGGLRKVTGQIGKRGNQDSYQMKTPTATIGIRGTTFTVEYVESEDQKTAGQQQPVLLAFSNLAGVMSDAEPFLVADAGAPPPPSGLFVYTWQGAVLVTNSAGSFPVPQNTGFQFTGPASPPVPIPPSGMPTFSPPSHFSNPGGGAGGGGGCKMRP